MKTVVINYMNREMKIVGPFVSFMEAFEFTENLVKKIKEIKDENTEVSPIYYVSPMDGYYEAGFNVLYHRNLPELIKIVDIIEPSEIEI